ncbi:MAG: RNA 3'-terminal phosphate cyclase [Nitrososphaerales archaeon]
MEFVRIDGSYGEGGGQILRTSVTLSAILKKPLEIMNIRSRRDNPGLRPQHVKAINAVASLCDAHLENVHVGSDSIKFVPKEMHSDSIKIDIGTAGSVTMVLQTVVPAASLSGKHVEIELTGGTDVRWSPTTDYLRFVVRPAFNMIGIDFALDVHRRGYYPVGGGIVKATIEPCVKPYTFDMIKAPKVEPTIVSTCSSLPAHVAQRQLAAALAKLQKEGVACNSYSASVEQSNSPGSSILVCAVSNFGPFIGGDAIGEKGKRAEEVGTEAARKFLVAYNSNAPIDEYLADMLVVPLCLMDGRSRFIVKTVSQHLCTNLYITSIIVGCKYEISERGSNHMITINGGS